MKVLFFSAWYPNRYDAMAGLFVRKHAEAVAAQGVDVAVFYLMADANIRKREWIEQTTNGVREFYLYYPFSARSGMLMRVDKLINYLCGFFWGWKRIVQTWGEPDMTQANVLTRSAALSYYLYKRYSIPYIVVEHFTRYLPENLSFTNPLHKLITRRVIKDAYALMPVSQLLTDNMQKLGLQHPNYDIINNVVDDFFYTPFLKKKKDKFIFIHISCFFERHKNTCGILRAAAELYKQRQDFSLIMVGTGMDFQLSLDTAKELKMPASLVRFTGELSPQEVASEMCQSDCFIFFSNYETAGVVLSESLAIGIPIITTPVGIAPQIINSNTGKLVEIRNETQLVETMSWMIDHSKDFNKATIRQHGKEFSYEAVGKHLVSIYKQTLHTL